MDDEELGKVSGGSDAYVRGAEPLYKVNQVFGVKLFECEIKITVLQVFSTEEKNYYYARIEKIENTGEKESEEGFVDEKKMHQILRFEI